MYSLTCSSNKDSQVSLERDTGSSLLSFIMFYCGYGVQIGVNGVIESVLVFNQLRFRTNLKYESQKH